jgi:uncharacterized protein YhhL (DUF1145 family)
MNPNLSFLLKAVLAFLWGYGLACAMSPTLPMAAGAVALIKAFTLIHILEMGLFWPRVKAAPGSRLANMAGIFLFGIFHASTLPPLTTGD